MPRIVLLPCMFCPMTLISNKRLTEQPRRDNMIGLKVLAITIIVTALISSVVGGAVVSVTVQSSIDQRLQAQGTPNPTIDPQANRVYNSSNIYQIPPNATKQDTNSSTSHASHHPSGSESMTAQDMYDMMESMDMYTQMQNGTMDAIMEEMMPMMVALMSDEMKSMMTEMMMGNMTDAQSGMGNQTMIQEMDKMLQTMDKSLTILNTIANETITNGNLSNETITTVTNSINQVMTMMDQLMQMIKTTTTDNSTMAPMSDLGYNSTNPQQLAGTLTNTQILL